MTKKKPIALEEQSQEHDARLRSPSVERNKEPILDVLRPHLLPGMQILEIASGTGEHGAHIASNIKGLIWQPSDLSPEARVSITAWADHLQGPDFKPPIEVDASAQTWPLQQPGSLDGLVCINMIHISPFDAAKGVISGAAKYLKPGGFLFFYGPFKREGQHTAPSNQAFDVNLKSRDSEWGIRDLEEIQSLVEAAGFALVGVTDMPANNLSVLFRKAL